MRIEGREGQQEELFRKLVHAVRNTLDVMMSGADYLEIGPEPAPRNKG